MADEVEQENFQGEHLDPLTIDILNNIRSRKVDLSNKCIIVIPSALYHLKHLQYLYLERNYLEELPSCFAENLCQLRWLDIRRNKLKHLPENISNLTNLKNLLLEDNCIERLPLQLGNLKNLSGLNLAKNPLEFPPKDVIESGTKAVLSYLRDFTALGEKFKGLDVQANSPELNNNLSSEKYAEAEELEESDYNTISETYHDSRNVRRHSFEEDILHSPPYQINPLHIKARVKLPKAYVPPLRKRELSSAPIRKQRKQVLVNQVAKPVRRSSGYLRQESFEARYHREVEKSERRKFNEKADIIIQKQKNKKMLDEWRRKNRQLQRTTKHSKHEVIIPYGNDLQKAAPIRNTHAQDVSINLEGDDKSNLLRRLRDQQVEERIQEHVRNIKEYRRSTGGLTVEEELKMTKTNLQKAIQLQKDLEEKRALEYRLRAFTAEEYAPLARTKAAQK